MESIGKEQVQISELIYHDEWEDPNYREHSITSSEIAVLEHVTTPQIEMLENCTCLGELKNVLSRNFAVYGLFIYSFHNKRLISNYSYSYKLSLYPTPIQKNL